MAGEVEESFSINLQAGSIHSGSISFGRFENEPLSWERRSSFSHNRYLEEVEKCSKPGSVIEKKAILEAHFKKKGLFGNSSSVSHDRSDRTTSENDGSERIGEQGDSESNEDADFVQLDQRFLEDFEANELGHHVQFEQTSQRNFEPSEDGHRDQFDKRSQEKFESNEEGHDVQFDEGPDVSVCNEQSQVTVCEREDAFTKDVGIIFSNLLMESDKSNPNALEDVIDGDIAVDEIRLAENETSRLLSSNNEASTEVKRKHDDPVTAGESSKPVDTSLTEPSEGVEKSALHGTNDLSAKLIDAFEANPDPAVTSVVNNVQFQRSTSSKASTDSARHPSRESPKRTYREKSLSKVAPPTTRSVSKTPKVEGLYAQVCKTGEKQIRESKRGIVPKVKKAAECQPRSLKPDSRGIQEAKRLNRTVNSSSTISDTRPKAAVFNFKCGERAERRKEFYMKLEEKLQAKEVEMNQIQAISQEKTEAEIKKLRKSLNFKATPMPSFYHTAVPPRLDGNKAVPNNSRTRKLERKSQGIGEDAAVPSKLKTGNDQAAHESVTVTETGDISLETCATTDTFKANLTSPTLSANRSCSPDSDANNQISVKKDRTKATTQKQRVVPESCKGAKRQSNEGKQKAETPKHGNEMTRKIMRSIGSKTSSSRTDNLAVRVAS